MSNSSVRARGFEKAEASLRLEGMDPSGPFMKVSNNASLPVKLLTSRVERRYSNIMLNVQNNTRHERQKRPVSVSGY
ncbi:hypothetical protein MUTS8_47220 (plasmid) [Escherichia coli]|uniref:hypothetical protein n=1 Tax=Escherichia coli TaxID=562 RepID=UPI0015EF2BD8|nr:hypothetical protein [Escherichia coli]BDY71361.1 hypothetical protein MUTS8_47220 [Escherichia coli]